MHDNRGRPQAVRIGCINSPCVCPLCPLFSTPRCARNRVVRGSGEHQDPDPDLIGESTATTTKCGQGDGAISTAGSRNMSSCKGFCTGHHGIANFPAVHLTEDGGSRAAVRGNGSYWSSQEPRAAAHRRTAGGEPTYTSCIWHSVAVRCKCAGEARY